MISLASFPLMMTKQFPSTLRAKETSLIRREAQEKTGSARYNSGPIGNEILMCLRASQKRKGDMSLHDPIGIDGEGNEITLIDVLGTDGTEVHNEVERQISLNAVRKLIETSLHGREKTVLKLRYGLLDGKMYAQQEVADKLGISRSYVSRIEKKAMERLKEAFETGGPVKKER